MQLRCATALALSVATLLWPCQAQTLGTPRSGGVDSTARIAPGQQSDRDADSVFKVCLASHLGDLQGASEITLYDSILVLATGSPHVDLRSVRWPHLPFGWLPTPGNAYGVAVRGSLLAVADGDFGLQLIDLSDPRFPVTMGATFAHYARAVALRDSLAYVASGDTLRIFDLSNAAAPPQIGVLGGLSPAVAIEVEDGRAYVASGQSGLFIADVSDPASPILLGQYNSTGSAQAAAARGDTVFLADGSGGVVILGTGDPQNPAVLSTLPDDTAYQAVLWDSLLFVAAGSTGVRVWDISPPDAPNLVTSIPNVLRVGATTRLHVTTGSIYVAGSAAFSVVPWSLAGLNWCGNGLVEPGEPCDDGNAAWGDGCDPCCQIENCLIQLPGDVNNSGSRTSADIITILSYCFKGGATPQPCPANGDVNCSGAVTAADLIHMVNFVFKGGLPPCEICNLSPLAATCN